MDVIELTSVDVKNALTPLTEVEAKLVEDSVYVKTRYGNIFVTIQGNRQKTPFITYPDLGLNCNCFGVLKIKIKKIYIYFID